MTVQTETTPRFTHDCDDCVFLGQDGDADLYFCEQSGDYTVIARFSDNGPDYTSGLASNHSNHPQLVEARMRARIQGLL